MPTFADTAFALVCVATLAACSPASAPEEPKDAVTGDDLTLDVGSVGKADQLGRYRGTLVAQAPYTAELGGAAPFHLYDYQAAAGEAVSLRAGSGEADLFLIVYGLTAGGWAPLAYDDDCTAGTLDPCIDLTLEASTELMVAVTTYAYVRFGLPERAAYSLCLGCAPTGDDGACPAEGEAYYVSHDAGVCAAVRFECDEHQTPFSDGCGCGCIERERDTCLISGCSGQLCQEATAGAIFGTCEWTEAYACYQTAVCERQDDGACGWTPASELLACLDAS